MDNGEEYEISEYSVNYGGANYAVTDSSESSLSVNKLGTFQKQSDSVFVQDAVPYFRKGGTNLDYMLKIVGFTEDTTAPVVSAKSNVSATGTSEKYKSFTDTDTSDEDGILHLKAPVAGNIQTVVIDTGNSSVTVAGLEVNNAGDNMGTVPIVEKDQYVLKVTGTVAASNKNNGYLYGNGYKSYPVTLTITNISDIDCETSFYTIEAKDSCLELSGSELSGTISTLKKGGTKTIKLSVTCGNLSDPYIDTGLVVTLQNGGNTDFVWEDFVPLRFFKGLYPITIAAESTEGNSEANLNGFLIYPDGNSKFFAVNDGFQKTVYVPSFGSSENKKYTLAFSGAKSGILLSDSTEMYYTVALGSTEKKAIELPSDGSAFQQYITFGEKNETQDAAYDVEDSFEAYLREGDIDYYTAHFSDSAIVKASDVPKSVWAESNESSDTVSVDDSYDEAQWTTGTLTESETSFVYAFWAEKNEPYTIKWADKEEGASQTADIKVSASTSPSDFSGQYLLFNGADSGYLTGQTVQVKQSGFIFIKVEPFTQIEDNVGTFAISAYDKKLTGQTFTLYDNSFNPSSSDDVDATLHGGKIYKRGYTVLSFDVLCGNTYTVIWADADGYPENYPVDGNIVVSAFSDEFLSNQYWQDADGYNNMRTVTPSQNGKVYLKITNKDNNKTDGDYGIGVVDGKKNVQIDFVSSQNGISVLYEPESIATSAWKEGTLSSAGDKKLYAFTRKTDTLYRVIVDDKNDGSGKYTGSVWLHRDFDTYQISDTENGFSGGYSTNYTSISSEYSGAMYLQVSPEYKNSSNTGTFAIAVIDGENNPVELTELVPSSSLKTGDWKWGCFYGTDAYEVIKFSAKAGVVYNILWDDASDGSRKYSADIEVTASSYQSLESPFFSTKDNGYSCMSPVFTKTDGYIYIKIANKGDSGEFNFAVMQGTEPVELEEEKCVKCNFYASADLAKKIPSSAWHESSIEDSELFDIYYFKAEPKKMYRLYIDSGFEDYGSGKYTGIFKASVGNDIFDRYYDADFAENAQLVSFFPISMYYDEGITIYPIIIPYSTGTYAIALVDQDYNTVDLVPYNIPSLDEPPKDNPVSTWSQGELTSASHEIEYEFTLPANTMIRIFWDDKKSDESWWNMNSGSNSARIKIKIEIPAQNFYPTRMPNHYSTPDTYLIGYSEDVSVTLKISVLESETDIGTFAIAAFDGNDMIQLNKK